MPRVSARGKGSGKRGPDRGPCVAIAAPRAAARHRTPTEPWREKKAGRAWSRTQRAERQAALRAAGRAPSSRPNGALQARKQRVRARRATRIAFFQDRKRKRAREAALARRLTVARRARCARPSSCPFAHAHALVRTCCCVGETSRCAKPAVYCAAADTASATSTHAATLAKAMLCIRYWNDPRWRRSCCGRERCGAPSAATRATVVSDKHADADAGRVAACKMSRMACPSPACRGPSPSCRGPSPSCRGAPFVPSALGPRRARSARAVRAG